MPSIVVVRGGGDLASGVALRLQRAGLAVVVTELALPVAVRRTVSFAEAVYEGQATIEGVTGERVTDPSDTLRILSVLGRRHIPVLVDPMCTVAQSLHALAIIDGRMTKRPPEALTHHASLYIGLGPGFESPTNCQAVVETQRGHTLGRVVWAGIALDDTSKPAGDERRVLRAPVEGVLESRATIGQHFEPDQQIASVSGQAIVAPFAGTLRGLLHPGNAVSQGMKIGDLDLRDDPRLCQTVSDKSLAVGGGVLEALLTRPEVRAKLWV
jgi:xanthine dehydrogenase accessory factor